MLFPKDNPFGGYWKKRADLKWSMIIKQAGRCAYCGTAVNLEAHHLIARKNNRTRHEIDCGICLCRYHHRYCPQISPHLARDHFETWLKSALPQKYQWMENNRIVNNNIKVDFKKVLQDLSRT